MKNKKNFLKSVSILDIVALCFSLVLIVLQIFHQMHRPRVSTDFVSFALSSVAPLFGIGMPYVDFWGINPPGLLMMLGSWALAFGNSLQSWYVLYTLCLFLISLATWLVLKKLFRPIESLILFIIWGVLFFSNAVQSQFFPSEINGLLLSMIAAFLIFRNKMSRMQVLLACFTLILAGQMKEVFAFVGLMMFPHLLATIQKGWKEVIKFSSSVLVGIFSALALIFLYLLITGSVAEYKQITQYKSDAFLLTDLQSIISKQYFAVQYPKDRFFHFGYQIPIIFIAGFIVFSFWLAYVSETKVSKKEVTSINFKITKKHFLYFVALCFYLGSIFGYGIQNRYGNKYDIAIILPTIMILAIMSKIFVRIILSLFLDAKNKYYFYIALFLNLIFISIFLLPRKVYILEPFYNLKNYNLKMHYHLWQNLEDPEFLKLENKITANTSPSDCITKVYGWGVGDAYYYSHRKSCSKHFLVNIIPANQLKAYADEIAANPPSALIYTRIATDMNVDRFEELVFDFTQVINNCYSQDSEFDTLYWPKEKGEALRECIKIGNKFK